MISQQLKTWLIIFVLFAQHPYSMGQQNEIPSRSNSQLRVVLNDTFEKDDRTSYAIEGKVEWDSEQELTLFKNSSIQFDVEGGPWAKATLDLEYSGSPGIDYRISFLLSDGIRRQIRFESDSESDGNVRISSYNIRPGVINITESLERRSSVLLSDLKTISIELRFGLIELSTSSGEKMLTSFLEPNSGQVDSIRIETVSKNITLKSININSLPADAELSAQIQAAIEDSKQVRNEIHSMYQQGAFEQAVATSELHLEKLQASLGSESLEYDLTQNNLAACYIALGRYGPAMEILNRVRVFRENRLGRRHPHYAATLNSLAAAYQYSGNFQKAKPLCIEVCRIWKDAYGEDHSNYAAGLNNLGALFWSTGDYRNAEPLYLKATEIWKAIHGENHFAYASGLTNLGELYEWLGDFTKAEQLQSQALAIREKVLGPKHPEYAQSLQNLARLYERLGEYEKAEAKYLQAKQIREKEFGENHPDIAQSIASLASLYHRLNRNDEAETLYHAAVAAYQNGLGENHPYFATSLNNLAIFYQDVGKFDLAEQHYQQAMDIVNRKFGKESLSYAVSLSNLVSLYCVTGKLEDARKYGIEVIRIREKIVGTYHPSVMRSYNNLGAAYRLAGNEKESFTCYKKGIEIVLEIAKRTLPGLSEAECISWVSANSPTVDSLLSLDAKTLADVELYDLVWNTKRLVTRLRGLSRLPSEASEKAKEIESELRKVRQNLSRLVGAKPPPNKFTEFKAKVSEVVEEKEALEKQLAKLSPVTQLMLESRDATTDDLIRLLPPKTAIVDISRLPKWEKSFRKIKSKNQDGVIVEKSVGDFIPVDTYHAFVLRPDDDWEIPWIQLGPSNVIDSIVLQWRRQLNLDQDVKDSQKTQTNSKFVQKQPPSQLRKLLWEKLDPYLQGCEQVIIIPDGQLNFLPWSALPGRKPKEFLVHDYALSTASYGQLLYKVLKQETVSSRKFFIAGGIDFNRRKASDTGSTTELTSNVAATPSRIPELDNDKANWGSLEGSRIELNEITQTWDTRGPIESLKGDSVLESSVSRLLTECRYAHLATHGFFSAPGIRSIFQFDPRKQTLFEGTNRSPLDRGTMAARNPLLLSGIVLSGANLKLERDELGVPVSEDGILTGEEIVGLDLRELELVTLSACETGLGDVAAGEGVFGLQRAFHQAGARSVIASLWRVDDQATKTLMVEFYRNLWEKKMSKAQALRQAQLAMIDLYDPKQAKFRGLGDKTVRVDADSKRLSPRYWAAFQLSGDWR